MLSRQAIGSNQVVAEIMLMIEVQTKATTDELWKEMSLLYKIRVWGRRAVPYPDKNVMFSVKCLNLVHVSVLIKNLHTWWGHSPWPSPWLRPGSNTNTTYHRGIITLFGEYAGSGYYLLFHLVAILQRLNPSSNIYYHSVIDLSTYFQHVPVAGIITTKGSATTSQAITKTKQQQERAVIQWTPNLRALLMKGKWTSYWAFRKCLYVM